MSAEQEIADLDLSLELDGETIILRRPIGTTGRYIECTTLARIIGSRMSGLEIADVADGVQVQRIKVIASITGITRSGWPGADWKPVPQRDKRVPLHGDIIICSAGVALVQAATPWVVADTMVRIDMTAKGDV